MADVKTYRAMDAKDDTGTEKMCFLGDADYAVISIHTDNSANLTVKFAISDQDDPPTVTSAQSSSNDWEYVQIVDAEDGSTVDGNTGFAVAGTDDDRKFTVNFDGAKWLIPVITAISAGDLTIDITTYNRNAR